MNNLSRPVNLKTTPRVCLVNSGLATPRGEGSLAESGVHSRRREEVGGGGGEEALGGLLAVHGFSLSLQKQHGLLVSVSRKRPFPMPCGGVQLRCPSVTSYRKPAICKILLLNQARSRNHIFFSPEARESEFNRLLNDGGAFSRSYSADNRVRYLFIIGSNYYQKQIPFNQFMMLPPKVTAGYTRSLVIAFDGLVLILSLL